MPEDTPAASIHIIGLGSPLGADRLGLLAARKLESTGFRTRYPGKPVAIDTCLSPALLATQYVPGQALILLDAYCSADPPACVRCFSSEELETLQRPASSHGFDIRQALALIRALGNDSPPVLIIGICAGAACDAIAPDAPGAILEAALPGLLNTIDNAVRDLSTSVATRNT